MTGQVHLVQCHEISYTVYLHVAIQPRPLINSFNYSYQRNNLKSSNTAQSRDYSAMSWDKHSTES